MRIEIPNLVHSQLQQIADLAAGSPIRSSGYAQVALLLAGQALAARGVEIPGFAPARSELTADRWISAIRVIAVEVERHTAIDASDVMLPNYSGIFTPDFVERSLEKRHSVQKWQPGELERLRQAVEVLAQFTETRIDQLKIAQFVLQLFQSRGGPGLNLRNDVARLSAAMTHVQAGDRLYCAYQWSVGVAFDRAAQGAQVTFEQPNGEIAALCAVLAVAMSWKFQVSVADPLDRISKPSAEDRFDAAFLSPPLGQRFDDQAAQLSPSRLLSNVTSYEAAAIVLGTTLAARTVCLFGHSFLFRTARADQAFKEDAIAQFGLDTVVNLPGRPFGSETGIQGALLRFEGRGVGQKQVLMVRPPEPDSRSIRHARDSFLPENLIDLIDAREEGELSRLVPAAEIASADFNLMTDRYVLNDDVAAARKLLKNTQTVTLGDVCEIFRAQAYSSKAYRGDDAGGEGGNSGAPMEVLYEVAVSDVGEAGLVESPAKILHISEDTFRRSRPTLLQEGDILLVIKGSAGKVGYIRGAPPVEPWVTNQSFAILRLRKGGAIADPRVLFSYLASKIGQTTIQNLVAGTTIPGIGMADLKRLAVPLPAREAEGKIGKQVDLLFQIGDDLNALKRGMESAKSTLWPDAQSIDRDLYHDGELL